MDKKVFAPFMAIPVLAYGLAALSIPAPAAGIGECCDTSADCDGALVCKDGSKSCSTDKPGYCQNAS